MPKTGGDKFVSSYYGIYYTPHLRHFGIPGMKWGIRRYQNPDGTLTEEGKIRYGRKIERGRELRDRGKNDAKIALRAIANHYALGVGKWAAENIMKNLTYAILPAATIAAPEFAPMIKLGKMGLDFAFAGLKIANVTNAVKDMRAIGLADKIKESTDEMKERNSRLKIQSEMSTSLKKIADNKKRDPKNPGILTDPGGFAKSKGEKLANDIVDGFINKAVNKVTGNDKNNNSGGGKKKNKGGNNDNSNGGNGNRNGDQRTDRTNGRGIFGIFGNRHADAENRVTNYQEIMRHPERHTVNEVRAAREIQNLVQEMLENEEDIQVLRS